MSIRKIYNNLDKVNPKSILEKLKDSYVPVSDNEKCKLIEVTVNENGNDIFRFERDLNVEEIEYFRKWYENYTITEVRKDLLK